MAKRYDITDKLNFEENPVIVVKGKEIEVDSSAVTVLKIMMMSSEAGEDPSKIVEMVDILFTNEGKKIINSLKLNFNDLQKLLDVAMDLAIGSDPDEEGEPVPEEIPEKSGMISLMTGI